MLITPKIKDDCLNWICMNCPVEALVQIDQQELLISSGIPFDILAGVLRHFERIGLIEELNCRRVATFLIVNAEAHEFVLRGGFLAQEEVFETNIAKLILEIENLKKQIAPDHLDTVNKISSIASAILGGLTLFKKSS